MESTIKGKKINQIEFLLQSTALFFGSTTFDSKNFVDLCKPFEKVMFYTDGEKSNELKGLKKLKMNQIQTVLITDFKGKPNYDCDYIIYDVPADSTKLYVSDGNMKLIKVQIKEHSSITSIANHGFAGCIILPEIELPSTLITIGSSAFFFCNELTTITIPSSVTTIERRAFHDCKKLKSIVFLSSSIQSIKEGTFFNCTSLNQIDLPSSITVIGESAFAYCSSLTEIKMPKLLSVISNCAFSNCTSLTKVVLNNTLRKIGDFAFEKCTSLSEMNFPSSLRTIEKYSFDECRIQPGPSMQHLVDSSKKEQVSFPDLLYKRKNTVKRQAVPRSIFNSPKGQIVSQSTANSPPGNQEPIKHKFKFNFSKNQNDSLSHKNTV